MINIIKLLNKMFCLFYKYFYTLQTTRIIIYVHILGRDLKSRFLNCRDIRTGKFCS
jgi:hypothetical protein